MRYVVRPLALAAVSVLLISGCASKGWVRDFVGVRAGETDQHVAKVEEKVNEETQRTEGLGTRLNSTETSLGEVRGLTSAAQEQADNAVRKAEASDSRLTTLWSNRDKRTPVDTIQSASASIAGASTTTPKPRSWGS
jgi:septal ring factor EnvC (AmiA/AmiB activator)